ncbi:MAG: hypothetical protein J7494_02015 [Sphingobium sp.]|nr:hypothetical protein [Sphingobium sp.]
MIDDVAWPDDAGLSDYDFVAALPDAKRKAIFSFLGRKGLEWLRRG